MQRFAGGVETLFIVYPLRNKQGFTIIEIMLALSISILILIAIGQWYRMQWEHMIVQNNLIAMVEQAHLTSDYLTSEIQQAGYLGCVNITNDFPVIADLPEMINLHLWLTITPHVITIQHANQLHNELSVEMHDANQLIVNNTVRLKSGDIVVISNCKQAEIFKINHVFYHKNTQCIIPEYPLHHLFQPYAEMSLFEVNTFFIDNGYFTMRNLHHRKMHLVKGVREMTFSVMNDQDQSRLIGITLRVFQNAMERSWHAYIPYP